jgi:hypothetical protein
MSLVTTASLWTNEDNQKKRTPTMRRTIKLKPNLSNIGEPDEYVSQSENYQNLEPTSLNEIQEASENRNNRVNNLLNKITSLDIDDTGKMGSFNPLPNPNMNVKKDMDKEYQSVFKFLDLPEYHDTFVEEFSSKTLSY